MDVELPERLDLEDNYESTVTNLINVRRAADGHFTLNYLDFDKIRYISPSAALILASEIDRWKTSTGNRVKARHCHWDVNVKRLLYEMGFFELLRLQPPDGFDGIVNTTFLPFIRGGYDSAENAGRQAQLLRKRIDDVAGVQIKKHLLFSGLTEAITNVSQHAYKKVKEGFKRSRHQPWWMSAAYKRETNTVIVCFYDHGFTIPGTLPTSRIFEQIKMLFYQWNDGERIKAAMEMGRSSVKAEGRGKGLGNFLEIIAAHAGGQLTILSRKGRLKVVNDAQACNNLGNLQFTSESLQTGLRGTLIEWKFVPNKAENDNDRERLL